MKTNSNAHSAQLSFVQWSETSPPAPTHHRISGSICCAFLTSWQVRASAAGACPRAAPSRCRAQSACSRARTLHLPRFMRSRSSARPRPWLPCRRTQYREAERSTLNSVSPRARLMCCRASLLCLADACTGSQGAVHFCQRCCSQSHTGAAAIGEACAAVTRLPNAG